MNVSVPFGELFYFYLLRIPLITAALRLGFRPLWGAFLFLYAENNEFVGLLKSVSVPFGDLFYVYSYARLFGRFAVCVSVPYGDLLYVYYE